MFCYILTLDKNIIDEFLSFDEFMFMKRAGK